MSRFLWWVAEALGFLVLNVIFAKPATKLSAKLGENAVIGWLDDRLGETLGITAPTIQQVVEFGLPALLAIAVLLALHWIQTRFFPHASVATQLPRGDIRANIISQIPRQMYDQATTVRNALGLRVTIAWVLIVGCVVGLAIGVTMLAVGPQKITAPGKTLSWIFSGMAGKSDENGFRVGDIQFLVPKNETGKAIRLVDAYIQSGMDGGKRRPLLLNTYENGLIPLSRSNPIPPDTENITLMAEFPNLSEAEFMKDWGNITFTIQDSEHTFQGWVAEKAFREVFDRHRPVAPAPRATAAALSDFGWGFERYPAYDFVGMSMGSDGQILVHLFQAQGQNNTLDPIVKLRSFIRSDRTNQEIPVLYNPGNANLLRGDELNPIPVGALVSSIAYFSKDREPIPLKQFLADWVPFTFFVEYDGKSYRRTFTLEEIEPRIQRYEQDMRKMSVKPAQISSKTSKFYSQRNKNDLADALTDLSGILNTTGDDIVKKAEMIARSWDREMVAMGQQNGPDTNSLLSQLRALSDSTVILNHAIYDDDGFLQKHKNYADEMNSVLQLTPNAPNSNPISILQSGLNGFVNGITTIELATKYNDKNLIANMAQNMTPALFSFQKGDESFRHWLGQTRERIEAFRNTLG